MTKRRTTKSAKAAAASNEVVMTVQLDDLELGRASSPAKGKGKAKGKSTARIKNENPEQLLDKVSQLLEQNQSLESSRNVALEQVDAISQKIEKLTESIGASTNCDFFEETADKVKELDAKLNSLQNALKKQAKRSDKVESGLQSIDELGTKIELLSEQVKLAAEESKNHEDYAARFTSVGEQLNSLYQFMEGQSVDPKVISEHAKLSAKIDEKIDILGEVVTDSAKEAKKRPDPTQLVDSLTQKVDAMEKSLQKSIADNAPAPVDVPDFSKKFDQIAKKLNTGFGKQIDSLGELFMSNMSNQSQPELDFSKQFEQLADSLNKNLDAKIEAIEKSLQKGSGKKAGAGDSKQVQLLADKIEQLQQSLADQKPGESAEQVDYSAKLDELTLNVATLQESLDQKIENLNAQPGDGSFDSNLLWEKFDSLQASVVDKIQTMSVSEGGEGGVDHTEQLNSLTEKVEWISQLMEDQNANGESSEDGSANYSSQLSELSDRLDSTQSKIDRLVESIGPLVESLANGATVGAASNEAEGDESSEIEESAWEKQKRELLAGYGAEPGADNDAIRGDSSADSADSADGERGEWINEDENEEEAPQGESADVLALKSELEEKLRRAEIEISIERAKLHREKHQLEQQQQEMEQKMAKLRSASSDSDDGESGGGRWSRFLGKKGEE